MALATLSLAMLATSWENAQAVNALTTTGTLISFSATNPSVILSTTAVSGLNAGDTLFAIDYRPLD